MPDEKIIRSFLCRADTAIRTAPNPTQFTVDLHTVVSACIPLTRAGMSTDTMSMLLNHASELWAECPPFHPFESLPTGLVESWINLLKRIQQETENPNGAKLGFLLFVSKCMDHMNK